MANAIHTADSEQQAAAPGWWPLAVISSAQLMAILDTTIIFVALPSAQHAVGLSTGARQWIITAYTLAFAGLLLVAGRLADKFGSRRTLMAGVIGFAAASAVGGASVDAAMLLAARAAQGASAALLISSTKSLLVTVYNSDEKRAKAIGIFTAANAAGGALGLILGGVLTAELSWRWCMYVNVAVALVAIIRGPAVLPERPGHRQVRIDLPGAALVTAGMAALVYGLGEAASDGWGSAPVVGSLSGAAVTLAAFTALQVGQQNGLLPLRVLHDRNRAGALLANTVNNLSTFGMMLILTYQLQTVLDYSALETGLALLPLALGGVLSAALLAPRLGKRIAPRWLIAAGIVLSASGLVPLIFITPASYYLPLIFIATLIEGLGTGLGGPAMLQTSLRNVLPSDTGAAAAAGSTANQLGSSIGAALLNTIAATTATAYLISHRGTTAVTAADHGFATAAAWGAGILLVTAIPAIAMVDAGVPAPRRPITQADEPRSGDEAARA